MEVNLAQLLPIFEKTLALNVLIKSLPDELNIIFYSTYT